MGTIGIIASGTKKVIGIANLTSVIGPLSIKAYNEYVTERLGTVKTVLPYRKTYAWKLEQPVLFKEPVSYEHPNGAVIWVSFKNKDMEAVNNQIKLSIVQND
ncbi:hypothetical protein [Oceanobacillus neutriphilus]|uniref:Uncharacterized protein n=1 Tax=Oceanobacillus neutriphilus TaxID=531815 RepID=A0ABQ2NP35_9BACI|nr:hypothetical protein [Oceanobacillus neutriphilus]GGP08189.1 hypothetical protein GCM10011346_07240 [Oceanobacillus neutriphilus]